MHEPVDRQSFLRLLGGPTAEQQAVDVDISLRQRNQPERSNFRRDNGGNAINPN